MLSRSFLLANGSRHVHIARRLGGPSMIGGLRASPIGQIHPHGNVNIAAMFTERPYQGFATLREPYVKLDTGGSMQETLMQR